MNGDKTSEISSHKDLLYSEILNTSETSHVHDLFEKKQKSCTFPIQRSTVLARASKFLKSADKVDENVQNIEDVEDGQPVIDMNVTLIPRTDNSDYSEPDLSEDSDDHSEDEESVASSDSGDEAPEDIEEDGGLCDKLVHKVFMASSELLQSDTSSKNDCKLNNLKIKYPENKEQEDILLNQKSDSDYEQSDSGANNVNLFISSDLSKELVKCDKKPVRSNQLSEQGNKTQNRSILEISKTVFELQNSDLSRSSSKHESSTQSLDDLKLGKRKLISVIEEDNSSNLCSTKTQKIV